MDFKHPVFKPVKMDSYLQQRREVNLRTLGINLAFLFVVAVLLSESRVVESAKGSGERRSRGSRREDKLPLKAEKSPATSRGIPGMQNTIYFIEKIALKF